MSSVEGPIPMIDEDADASKSPATTRRGFLRSAWMAAGPPLGVGTAYRTDRSFEDRDEDGIPDHLERSASFHRSLEGLFGAEAFAGLDPDRKDLLIDVRYVGDATVDDRVKAYLEELFRDNGIYAQWLDYPDRYDEGSFLDAYGYNVRKILWSRGSFYHREIEADLKNIAFQLVVVPGRSGSKPEGTVYSPSMDHLGDGWYEGWINGMNFGNRAVIGARESIREQARLAFHEIAHLVLCHDDDPSNPGVMGTQEEVDLTTSEWVDMRGGLDAIRDTTDYDVTLRRCLWAERMAGPCSGCR